MLNRKASKSVNGAARNGHSKDHRPAPKSPPKRHRFIISAKAHRALRAEDNRHGSSKNPPPPRNGHAPSKPGTAVPAGPAPDLTETIKTLVHLAHEHGHV